MYAQLLSTSGSHGFDKQIRLIFGDSYYLNDGLYTNDRIAHFDTSVIGYSRFFTLEIYNKSRNYT